MKRVKVFFINTLLLTFASIIMSTIGISFNIYISNQMGPTGMGLFQLILSIYVLATTFAISGVKLASTRLVTEELSRGNAYQAKRAMYNCVIYSFCFGIVGSGLLYFNAEYIAIHWLLDVRTILPLQILAISLPFVGMSAAINGYFIAVRRVVKNAITQVLEQFIKIGITILGLTVLLPYGVEYACIVVIIGTCFSEILSFFLIFILYRGDIKKYNSGVGEKSKGLITRMFNIALPVAISTYIRSGLNTLEHLLIPIGLKKSGIGSENALGTYGMIQGMVLPIILFPSSILISLANLLVPELTEAYTLKHKVHIKYIIGRIFQITLIFSVFVMGILFEYSYELGMFLYNSEQIGEFIKILAPLVLIMYMDMTVDGMLKGLNQQVRSMIYNIIDASISVILVYFLLPKYAIMGYIVMIYISEILNFALSISRLIKVTNCRLNIINNFVKPLLGIVLSISIIKLVFEPANNVLELILLILGVFIIYFIYLLITRSIKKEDIEWAKGILK